LRVVRRRARTFPRPLPPAFPLVRRERVLRAPEVRALAREGLRAGRVRLRRAGFLAAGRTTATTFLAAPATAPTAVPTADPTLWAAAPTPEATVLAAGPTTEATVLAADPTPEATVLAADPTPDVTVPTMPLFSDSAIDYLLK